MSPFEPNDLATCLYAAAHSIDPSEVREYDKGLKELRSILVEWILAEHELLINRIKELG